MLFWCRVIALIIGATFVATINVIYAVNCAGEAYTDSNGIHYEADRSGVGIPVTWPYTIQFGGILGTDRKIYRTAMCSVHTKIVYELTVAGDGWYALLLQFSEDSTTPDRRIFDVLLNGELTILSNYHMFRRCGMYNICNEVIYFHICLGVLRYVNQSSIVVSHKVRLEIMDEKLNGVISGIVLFKGQAGEGKKFAGTKTVVYFEPKEEPKCGLPGLDLFKNRWNHPSLLLNVNITNLNVYMTAQKVAPPEQPEAHSAPQPQPEQQPPQLTSNELKTEKNNIVI